MPIVRTVSLSVTDFEALEWWETSENILCLPGLWPSTLKAICRIFWVTEYFYCPPPSRLRSVQVSGHETSASEWSVCISSGRCFNTTLFRNGLTWSIRRFAQASRTCTCHVQLKMYNACHCFLPWNNTFRSYHPGYLRSHSSKCCVLPHDLVPEHTTMENSMEVKSYPMEVVFYSWK